MSIQKVVVSRDKQWILVDDTIFSKTAIKYIDMLPHMCNESHEGGACDLAGMYEFCMGSESFYATYEQWNELLSALDILDFKGD